jgi:type II secretory pathway component GspD/PulD (secretin)
MTRTPATPALVAFALLVVGLAGAPAAELAAQQQPQPALVTVSFEGSSIQDVVAFFADYADRSIVLGADVTGTVTAEIQRQRWDLALEAILRSQGLYARELESGIILVENPGARIEEPQAVATRVFRLSYTPAAEMQAVVQSMLSEGGTASVLPSINALVVTDSPDVLDRVAALLR